MNKFIDTSKTQAEPKVKDCPLPWWKRLGFLGFMFFFVKGLGWIAIFSVTYIWGPEAIDSVKCTVCWEVVGY